MLFASAGCELGQVPVQVVAEVVLDASTQAVEQLAHAIAHDAGSDGQTHDGQGKLPDPCHWDVGPHPVDRGPDEPGWNTCQSRGYNRQQQAQP